MAHGAEGQLKQGFGDRSFQSLSNQDVCPCVCKIIIK